MMDAMLASILGAVASQGELTDTMVFVLVSAPAAQTVEAV